MRKELKERSHFIRNIIVSFIALGIVTFILMIAPNYTRNDITNKISLVTKILFF